MIHDMEALLRIKSVLECRILASYEQLQVKVCECGPMRPTPARLQVALNDLVEANELRTEKGPWGEAYFYWAETPERVLAGRRAQLYPVMSIWNGLKNNDAHQLAWLISESAPSRRNGNKVTVGNTTILTLNERAWLELDDRRLWDHIAACLQERQCPAVIARRITPECRWLLKRLSIPMAESYRQFFPPEISDLLEPVRDKGLGGIKDLSFVNVLPERLLLWLRSTLSSPPPDRALLRWAITGPDKAAVVRLLMHPQPYLARAA